MAGSTPRTQLLAYIQSAPIYFASTHGIYDLKDPLEMFTVPPNTYIFEAASVGEATLTTIDKPLWDLIQKRREFAGYISSTADSRVPIKKNIIQNLHLYKPGDKIYKRVLIFEDENEFDNTWGYYTFPPGLTGIPFPQQPIKKAGKIILAPPVANPPSTPFLQELKRKHFFTAKTIHTRGGPNRHVNRGERKDNYSNIQFIKDIISNQAAVSAAGPAIFIFSSCASYWNSPRMTDEESAKALEIGRTQSLRDLEFAEMGFTSGPATQGVNNVGVRIEPPRLLIKRASKTAGRVVESFALESKAGEQLTRVEEVERRFLGSIGNKPVREVDSRFPAASVPDGAMSVFIKAGDVYSINVSPGGRPWWTKEELVKHLEENPGVELYFSDGKNFTLISKSSMKGGKRTRRFPRKSKRSHKIRRRFSRKSPFVGSALSHGKV